MHCVVRRCFCETVTETQYDEYSTSTSAPGLQHRRLLHPRYKMRRQKHVWPAHERRGCQNVLRRAASYPSLERSRASHLTGDRTAGPSCAPSSQRRARERSAAPSAAASTSSAALAAPFSQPRHPSRWRRRIQQHVFWCHHRPRRRREASVVFRRTDERSSSDEDGARPHPSDVADTWRSSARRPRPTAPQ